ncbi:MAG: response regulator [Ruminiclostridium sp.]|nr:response regulator [Ruminiclostridium sp.]
MKKFLIVSANFIIIFAIIFFVIRYADDKRNESSREQTEYFLASTVAMERVTANYLEGEQHICDTWANTINAYRMTVDEAMTFLTSALTVQGASAQIIFDDDGIYSGFSTEAHKTDPSDRTVSYKGIDIFTDVFSEKMESTTVQVTRTYTNPVNGLQSLAFCRTVTLEVDGTSRKALVLRVLPVSILEKKWVFPNEDYEDAEISIIDSDGSYMIRSSSFKNSNFFEFYRSYNKTDSSGLAGFEQDITTGSGTKTILNSKYEPCLISYTPVLPTNGWTLISYIPESKIRTITIDWFFTAVIFFALILLLILDMAVFLKISRDLRIAAQKAENANKAKTYFLSTMSHDIRTPMNSILGMNEMVLRECRDEEIAAYSEHIRTSGNTLLGLINDILDFSKIEAGKLDILNVEYDLASVLNDLVSMAQNAAEAKGLGFAVNIDRNTPKFLNGDEIRIKQAITNILSNAVKYTKRGMVTFSIGYDDIEGCPDDIMLNVSVEDTGIGIKEEDIDKLFAAFQRVDEVKNRGIEGTGLGITITQSLLNMMGSALDIKSEYGKGSVFSFSLRQHVVKREAVGEYETAFRRSVAERKRYKEKFTAPGAHILVVDDTPVNITVFKSLLKRTGMSIDAAESGEECIRMASLSKYDMIFLDHMMPEKDGIETMGELKRLPDNPNAETPVVCLTANAVSGMREMYLEAGFDDYITKPIDPDALETAILAYLPKNKIMPPEPEKDKDDGAFVIPEFLYHIGEINIPEGIKHCGSAAAYIDTIKVYSETAAANIEEIERFWNNGDIRRTTVKIHALKSTSRIIGADGLGAFAEKLEKAGNAGDTERLADELPRLLSDYRKLTERLAEIEKNGREEELPLISDEELRDAYTAMLGFSDTLDYDSMAHVVDILSGYRIPDRELPRWEKLRNAVVNFDYELIPDILSEGDE